MRAVQPQRLCHRGVAAEPAEPCAIRAGTRAEGRPSALEWRPRDAESRAEGARVDARLRAVPHTWTERQALAHANVVLEIARVLGVEVRERGIAGLDREERRLACLEVVRAAEGVRAEVVVPLVGVERAA